MKFVSILFLILVSGPAHAQKESSIFVVHVDKNTIVEIESYFPGSVNAWNNFLIQNIRPPEWAIEKRIHGTVLIKFAVDSDGTVTDVRVISGPNSFRQSVVDVIKMSPKWIPSTKNGIYVRSEKTQSFSF